MVRDKDILRVGVSAARRLWLLEELPKTWVRMISVAKLDDQSSPSMTWRDWWKRGWSDVSQDWGECCGKEREFWCESDEIIILKWEWENDENENEGNLRGATFRAQQDLPPNCPHHHCCWLTGFKKFKLEGGTWSLMRKILRRTFSLWDDF